MPTALMGDHKVAIELLGESTIAERAWYTEGLRLLADGTLVVRGNVYQPGVGGLAPWYRISGDGGVTWQQPADSEFDQVANPLLAQRRDGSVVGFASAWDTTPEYGGRPGQSIDLHVLRSASWQALRAGESETIASTVSIPYMVPLVGDDHKVRYTPALWGQMVETESGHLIQAAYPVLEYGRTPRQWEEQQTFSPQYRTVVLYSRNDGASWHFLSSVASSDRYPLPPAAEGYCEPDLVYYEQGHLLCVTRTGGGVRGFAHERYTPLMASHSYDSGLTWDPPYPIAAYGVKPVLLRMSSGLTVCLTGRPGFFLLFSADDGRTWSTIHWVSQNDGRWAKSASGYGALVELEPGLLGVSYDEYDASAEKMVSKLRRYRLAIGRLDH